eukprot:9970337-Alexandrium_andersonii.AAC.1
MASVRCADLARRHGQCGAHRFWRPYRGGDTCMTQYISPVALLPGCHASDDVSCQEHCRRNVAD